MEWLGANVQKVLNLYYYIEIAEWMIILQLNNL